MTNKELGSAIRATLKTAGYAPRDISVRVRDCGYSTSANVTIKNPEIRLESVERLLSKFESIDRDYATGEILAGGNCYLFVDYADGIFDVPAQEMATTAAVSFSDLLGRWLRPPQRREVKKPVPICIWKSS